SSASSARATATASTTDISTSSWDAGPRARCSPASTHGWTPRTRSRRPAASGVHEAQRHAVALADGEVLVAIDVLARQRGRERPHAVRVILGVARVRVDLRAPRELQPRARRELDDHDLRDVARVADLRRRRARISAVLLDTEHAPGLEHPR